MQFSIIIERVQMNLLWLIIVYNILIYQQKLIFFIFAFNYLLYKISYEAVTLCSYFFNEFQHLSEFDNK